MGLVPSAIDRQRLDFKGMTDQAYITKRKFVKTRSRQIPEKRDYPVVNF
jgi:hypothetical protein